jgi:CDP-glucose 4,6-dehydratase
VGAGRGALEELVSRRGISDPGFWRNRRILLTGHTGFKGAWTALWLAELGAEVHGFALAPETEPSLWRQAGAGSLAGETIADLADRDAVASAVESARPQIVLHLAAQALVRRSYAEPLATIATNTMGTVHLLEALRGSEGLEAVLVVTTDKVYENEDTGRDFVEDDPLGGHDPYSASKAAAEILVRGYASSFFDPAGIPVATARAGNVIGGGDWSADRLVPDVWRAARSGEPLLLRHPDSTRPWQHVLEPLFGYFLHVEALVRDPAAPRALNFGPIPGESMTVAQVADAMSAALGVAQPWRRDPGRHAPEMKLLSLDPARARAALGWEPRLDSAATVDWTARWYAGHAGGADARTLCLDQIRAYRSGAGS